MQTIYTNYLIKEGWVMVHAMSYINLNKKGYELFFDTSNQLELYYADSRVAECYLTKLDDLVSFLEREIPN